MPESVNAPEVLPLDESLISSGDTFEIMRLDGNHAMIAWALGAATGHVAIAMRRFRMISTTLYMYSITPVLQATGSPR